ALGETAAALGLVAAVLLAAESDATAREACHARIERAARPRGMRILGPHCLGIVSTHARLNASIAAGTPQPGELALVSESSAIAAALIEWGTSRSVGFSKVVSLGDALDVDFADLLDYLATHPRTRSSQNSAARRGAAR